MSIEDEIIDRVKRGMLFPIIPKAKGSAPERALFVTEKMWGDLERVYEDEAWERRIGELLAHLEVFATGAPIGPRYLFLLYPGNDGVWEIRNPEKNPSLRVIGLFAKKDVFVATEIARRDELGGWQDRRWKDVKNRAGAAWRNLFQSEPPLITPRVTDVVSGAENGVYYKSRA